jgi:hypothetical protein
MANVGKRKIWTAALIAALIALLIVVAVVFLFFVPGPENTLNPEVPPSEQEDKVSPAVESEAWDSPGTGYALGEAPPSLLDLPGNYAASGEFALGSVPEGKEFSLSENADSYAAIIAAIQSVDSSFNPEGYRVMEHVSHRDGNGTPDHGDVWVTFYIDDIKTSSSCKVNIDGVNIQYVNITRLYHPTADEIEQARQQRADFEASPASSRAIEQTKASMWPNDAGTTQLEYSEYYSYFFNTGKLFYNIVDNRTVDAMDGTIRAKSERIDCLEVLGR